MRCSCQVCGEYMVQDEKGVLSRCICPVCFNTCSACMGTTQEPISGDRFEVIQQLRKRYDGSISYEEDDLTSSFNDHDEID